MEARQLLDQLVKERDDLNTLIEGLRNRLRGSPSHASTKGSPKAHGRVWSQADRLKMSKLMKARLASKKKAPAARRMNRRVSRNPKSAAAQ